MRNPVIGLALSGGSALGFAHIGVIEELEKNGIKAKIELIKPIKLNIPIKDTTAIFANKLKGAKLLK